MRIPLTLAICIFLGMGMSRLAAQTPDATPHENPTANTGALKAQIETGGSYDAHSGNMTRQILDLRVPNAPGVYGLDFTRYYNSLRSDRLPGNTLVNPEPIHEPPADFGSPGWTHSWSWSVDHDEYNQYLEAPDPPEELYHMLIRITFPDGRVSKYKIVRSNLWYGGFPPNANFGPPYSPGEAHWPGGLHDHLVRMASDGSEFWLYRADGGAVHFLNDSTWGYQAREVFDPHGLRTDLSYDGSGHLTQVEQEGGKRLTITWSGGVIARVENGDSAGYQAVEYGYSSVGGWTILASVNYQNNPVVGQTISAGYTYETYVPPTGFFEAGPLLATADDRRFDGPMRQIGYSYRGTGCVPEGQPEPGYSGGKHDYFYASPTGIETEKSWRVDSNGYPIVVSGFSLGCFDGTRTEDNGLGGHRKFFYGHCVTWPGSGSLGYELAKVTDFDKDNPLAPGVPFERQSNDNGHPYDVWDGRGIKTRLTHADFSGLPSEVHHLGSGDGSSYQYNRVNPGSSESPDTDRIPNPGNHWLFSKKDERLQETIYTRDSRRRVKQIDHPDGSYETFVYDNGNPNGLNQVTTHRLASGAVMHYDYDGSNQLWREWNSVDGEGDATIYTYYGPGNHPEWTGLVATAQNARARANGKPFSAKMEYNGRQQVTKVTYPSTGPGTDPFITYAYDQNGNCEAITNELGQTTLYEYDDFGRCTSYTEPLNAPDWTGNYQTNVPSRTWFWVYDRVDGDGNSISSYAHTSKNWRLQIEPPYDAVGNRRSKVRHYDMNDQLVFEYDSAILPPGGSWVYPADAALHSYEYDENGQKKAYTDPQGRLTTYDYDLRNRLWKTNETVNTIPRTTETLYDTTGNKEFVIFPDSTMQRWENYDAFGQPRKFYDERNNLTDLDYWPWGPMKKLAQVTTHRIRDPASGGGIEDQLTAFFPDLVGRPWRTHFPDGSYEENAYEFGQLKSWRTRKGQTKYIHYDARGREDSHSWENLNGNCDPTANNEAAPCISRSWDDANRLSAISNIFSSIDYGYDNAGQMIWEGDEIAGSGGRTQTNYFRYPDGSIAHLHYPGGHYIRRDYTVRGQLSAVGWDDDENNWWMQLAHYTYLFDGKVDKVDYGNGMTSDLSYDPRGFVSSVQHNRTATGEVIASHSYTRDTRDRIVSLQKGYNPTSNPLENRRGDRFRYDEEGQLLEGWYNAADPANSGAGNTRYDGFAYDALGNRTQNNYVASRGLTSFVRRDNGLNQYSSWTPSSIYHDDTYPGWSPPGNGVVMAEGWITASYNALNQPIAIWSPAYQGTSDVAYFGFDPLGRCVKRWVSDSGDVYSNPATYFHYDGWNLLQEGSNAWGPARVYVQGNRVDEIVWSANTFTGEQAFHHYDARGHCTLLTDSVGNILEQYEYDAFGQPYFYDPTFQLVGSSTVGNRFLFTGREWLSDLKLYDYRNRMYQPELGRFLQPDPKQFAAGDYNLYRYCHNDPVNKNDPFGLADSVTIIFEPAMGNMKPFWATPAQIQAIGDSRGEAVTVIPQQGGITTTATVNPVTKDVAVVQKVQAVTLLPKKEEALGTKSALAKEEMSRIQGYRNATTNAGVAANELAEKGFKGNAEAAKSAVEASTRGILKEKTEEMRRQYDLIHGRK